MSRSSPGVGGPIQKDSQFRIKSKADCSGNLSRNEVQKERKVHIKVPKLPDPASLYQDLDSKDREKTDINRDRSEVERISKWESEKITLESNS